MCCHLQKNRPNSQKDRRLIKTGRQAGQTFGVRGVGHRGEKIMLHSTFTAEWWEASSPFSDSICCSETLDSTSFSSHHTPFLAYHSLNLFYLRAGSVGDLPCVSLSTWTRSRWAEQGRAPADRFCYALSSHLSDTEKRLSSCHHQGSMNPPHVSHTEAWLHLHRLKCHWTLMYSLFQTLGFWSKVHWYEALPLILVVLTQTLLLGIYTQSRQTPWHTPTLGTGLGLHKQNCTRAGCTAALTVNHSSPTHFLGILFLIPLFWSSCCTMFVKV